MKSFSELPLPDEMQRALSDLSFVKPTEIQKSVIPQGMKGCDLMACAETGSGKTAAYSIPLVARLLEDENKMALILAPTRELAQQIAEFIRQLCKNCHQLHTTCLVGGADIRKQLRVLKKNPRIVVATPGRLMDHLKRQSIKLDKAEILVLDEGDRMLDMGFAPQLNEILKSLPSKRQTSLFTATLSDKIQKLANKYLHKPEKVIVGKVSQPVSSIKQSVVQVAFKEKDDRIVDELNQRKGSVIVFLRTKHRTDRLARYLDGYGFSVGLIHGGRTQGQRNKAIRNFKKGTSRILCATDVAARGIDVPQVEHVINFDLPMMDEDYVHRIGRTARNGAEGEAVSFVTPEEHRAWQSLVRKYKIKGVELKGVEPQRQKKKSKNKKRGNDTEHPFQGRRRKKKTKTNSKAKTKTKGRGKKNFKASSSKKRSSKRNRSSFQSAR